MVDDASSLSTAPCLASARHNLQLLKDVSVKFHLNHLATYHYTKNT
jgi:hypothetical protein